MPDNQNTADANQPAVLAPAKPDPEVTRPDEAYSAPQDASNNKPLTVNPPITHDAELRKQELDLEAKRKSEQEQQDKAPEKAKRKPLSLAMSADDYCNRLAEHRKDNFEKSEKALNERQKAEKEQVEYRHKIQADELAKRRERMDDEMGAIKAYVEMWQRQDKERASTPDTEHAAMIKRHDKEHAELATKTGYDVRRPTMGDTIIPDFPDIPPAGHPWVRPLVYGMGTGIGGGVKLGD